MKIKVVSLRHYEDFSYALDCWVAAGWTPHFPVQVTKSYGSLEYHVTLTKEK